ncbi:rhomboid family intramembrane serine protease [Mannheimia massilioguelmaensis]|uniref:rhomboid family intramembrane serine protease n=1 Tax=Mannheimia massilioguelmaensis TaxID=1604354 RepID=UPI0005C8BB2C|nr:rhomboid family intramembrane serine protease [Mannheimia massilioguelmaensis]
MQLLFRSEIPTFPRQFRDYIRQKYQIELILKTEQNEFQQQIIAVYFPENTPHFDEIMQDLEEFSRNPLDERYEQASWETGDISISKDITKDLPKNATSNLRQQLLKTGPFTLVITLICLIVYGFEIIGFDEQIMQWTHYPSDFKENHQLWRYLTHTLVHLSTMHVTFNLVWWWIFASAIEKSFGTIKLIILYLCAAIITGIIQNFASGPNFFGLSGVVYAVLGCVVVIDKLSHHQFALPQGFFNMLIIGIAFGFISPIFGIEMGNAAHISGLIIGLVLGFIQEKITKSFNLV